MTAEVDLFFFFFLLTYVTVDKGQGTEDSGGTFDLLHFF